MVLQYVAELSLKLLSHKSLELHRTLGGISLEQKVTFEKELAKELTINPKLYGVEAFAIGKNTGSDDILFKIDNKEFEFAVVYLTWSKESNPAFSRTTLFKDWDEFVQNKMIVDNKEYLS